MIGKVIYFVDGWVRTNIGAHPYTNDAESLARRCIDDAAKAGFTNQQLEQDLGTDLNNRGRRRETSAGCNRNVPAFRSVERWDPAWPYTNWSFFATANFVDKVSRDCPDDLDALEAARTFCGDHAVELYCDGKSIARVKHGDEALNARDLHSG